MRFLLGMARLRIGVDKLGADGFRLELEGADGRANVVALAPGGGIRGRYEQDEGTIGLRSIEADTLALAELSWALGFGRVVVGSLSRLHDVAIDAEILRGEAKRGGSAFRGTIKARSAEASLELQLPDRTVQLQGVRVEDFELVGTAEGVSVRLGRAAVGDARTAVGPLQLQLTDLEVPDWVAIAGGELRVGTLKVGGARGRVSDLAAMLTRRDEANPSDSADPQGDRPALVLPFLEHLDGHVALDVVTDVTLPILGSRKATHRFRIDVDGGVVSYGALEKSLATLENLVLDFELEGNTLVLEKDLPLIPFDNVPLVTWDLDEQGVTLARDKRVRISTLIRPELPAKAKAQAEQDRKKKGNAVELRRLDVDGVQIRLAVGGPSPLAWSTGAVELGRSDAPAVGALQIEGAVHHAGETPEPGRLKVTAERIATGPTQVQLGDRELRLQRADLEAVDAVDVGFSGLRPSAVDIVLRNFAVRDVVLGKGSSA